MNSSRLLICGLALLAMSALAWFEISRESATKLPMPSPATASAGNAQRSDPAMSEPDRARPASNEESSVAVDEVRPDTSIPDTAARPPTATSFARRQEIERDGYDSAGGSIETALTKLAGVSNPKERAAFLRGMFGRLAEGQPSNAFAEVNRLSNPDERMAALRILVQEWRPETSAEAAALAVEKTKEMEVIARVGGHLRAVTDGGGFRDVLSGLTAMPDLAVEGARELLAGRDYAQFVGEIAGQVAANDPQRALSYGAGLEGKERADFLNQVAAGWAGTQGDAAWNWTRGESDPALRATLQATVLESWARNDPAAAALQLQEISGKDARQSLLAEIGGQWAGTDTRAALAWAQSLPDAAERDRALAAIRQAAPVGIGAVLSRDDGGYPVIREVLPGGAVSKSAAIAEGSQIAAVRDASGQFIETKDRELSDIIPLLRGAPGTLVAVQVIPPGGTFADRRTVVLTREQLLFKR